MSFQGHTTQAGQTMICNNKYLAGFLRVCEIKDLIWVMRFQSPWVYIKIRGRTYLHIENNYKIYA